MRVVPFAALAAASLLLAMPGSQALAADPGYLPDEEVVKKKDANARPDGWMFNVTLGASFALGSNSNVIGQTDGTSVSIGIALDGRAELLDGPHDWRNQLKINEVVTRSPVLDEFTKSIDELLFESVYYLNVSEVFGPFASFNLKTAIFPGEDVRPADVDYVVAGGGPTLATGVDRLSLTDAFQPLVMKQSIGVFVRPVKAKATDLVFKAGFGARETFADGALAVTDDAGTADVIEVTPLTDFFQAGAVIGAELTGQFEEGKITYEARAEIMFPLVNDDDDDRGVLDLTNYDFSAKVVFQLLDWMSVDYQFKALLQPQLLDEWQIQNALLLTFSYSHEHLPEAPPEAAPPVVPPAPEP